MENLNDSQKAVVNAIVDYGTANHFDNELIEAAVRIGYIESRLGLNTTNSSSSARGLFQYLEGTWNTYHGNLGSRENQSNQIIAMFRDLSKFRVWYNDQYISANIPKDKISLLEYLYIKHHDGVGYSNFLNAPGLSIIRAVPFDSSIVTSPATSGGGSGGGGGGGGGTNPGDSGSASDGWVYQNVTVTVGGVSDSYDRYIYVGGGGGGDTGGGWGGGGWGGGGWGGGGFFPSYGYSVSPLGNLEVSSAKTPAAQATSSFSSTEPAYQRLIAAMASFNAADGAMFTDARPLTSGHVALAAQ